MSQTIRDTQRVPRSCIACSKRKIKCSKTVPCTACVRRGDSHSCARELVRVKGEYKIARNDAPMSGADEDNDDENSAESLRAKVQYLEGLLSHYQRDRTTTGITTHDSSPGAQRSPRDEILQSFDDLHANTPADSQSDRAEPTTERSNEDLLMLLPIRESSEQIVKFSLQSLGWIHCALNASDFMKAHENFWDNLHPKRLDSLADHSWMALYLSILCVGSYFMEENDAREIHFLQEGFSGRRRPAMNSSIQGDQDTSKIWYDAVLKELNLADFLGRPSLATVQTLAILSLVHKNFSQAAREYTLLSVSISLARELGMDRLGNEGASDQNYPPSSCWSERKIRELGRRLWWTLVICDWMIMPLRPSCIAPGTFTTTLSIENDQSHKRIILYSGDDSLSPFSPLSYHVATADLASIMRPYRNRSVRISAVNLYKTIQDIESLIQSLPPHLSMLETINKIYAGTESLYASSQQELLVVLVESSRLTICLAAMPEILDTSNDQFGLQIHGRNAATNILELASHQTSMYFRKCWGPRMAIMSAGIYLMLDLICFSAIKAPSEAKTSLEKVKFALQALESGIFGKSSESQILERLVHVYHSHSDSAVTSQGLMRIMAFAASSCDLKERNTSPSEIHSPIVFNRLAPEKVEIHDGEFMGTESLIAGGISTTTDFDFDFDLFQQMSGDVMDGSMFALSDVFLGYGQDTI